VAGVTQTPIYRRFAWQVWHRWYWVARLDLVWARVSHHNLNIFSGEDIL